MRPSPLRLDNYFIKEMHFSLRPGFDQSSETEVDAPPPDFKVKADFIQPDGNVFQCRCELSVELPDDPADKFPYKFAVILVGEYTIVSKFDDELADKIMKANAPAVLYSAARELLLTLTGRSGYRPFLLPSATFVFDKEDKEQQVISATQLKPTRKRSSKKASKKR
jgi:preprotein translocase subunit SecB